MERPVKALLLPTSSTLATDELPAALTTKSVKILLFPDTLILTVEPSIQSMRGVVKVLKSPLTIKFMVHSLLEVTVPPTKVFPFPVSIILI